jgi:WD40 repeat protein/predicted Ser/Thr protein kinase
MPFDVPTSCPTCGDPLRGEGLPGSHCPRCLFRVAFDESTLAHDEDTPAAWTSFSGLELYEEIGRGGMGVVYRARQTALDRIVAVKVLLRARFATAEDRSRFHREAQAAARLHHPGIVGIHDVGETEGVPWFSMEYISGESLEHRVRDHPMDSRDAARVVLGISRALQHAHECGVLHRDLKPSNILLDYDGSPRIGDFGIARLATSGSVSAEITRTGQLLGSPGYAAPEQAFDGRADARTDVYGLGALLYHLLTTRPPFQGPTLDSILVQVRECEPLSPRRQNPSVARDLETICLHCLRKVPERRYQSAAAVADEMDRFLAGAPIQARPLGRLGWGWRWMVRHPAMASMWVVIFLLTAGLVGSSLAFAKHQARIEHRASLVSDARTLRESRLASGRTDSLAKLQRAWAIAPSAEIRHEAAASLALPSIGRMRSTEILPPDPSLSADGRFTAGFSGDVIVVREVGSGREITRVPGRHPGSLLQLDDHGRRIAIAAPADGRLEVISLTDQRLLATCVHPMHLHDLDWSGDLIATSCDNRFIYIWDDQGNLKHRLSGHESPLIRIAFRPRGQELASTSADSHVRLWHAARGVEIIRSYAGHQPHRALWWSADGSEFLGATMDGLTEAFPFTPAACLDVLAPPQDEPHSENLGSADLSEDARRAVVIDEQSARLWDFESGRLAYQRPKAVGQWLSSRFTPDGNGILFCGWADELTRVDQSLGVEGNSVPWPAAVLLAGNGNLIRDLSADGSQIVLSNDATGHFLVVSSGWPQPLHIRHPGTLAALIDPLGKWLLTSSYREPGGKVWSLPEGRLLHTICRNETVMRTCLLNQDRVIARTSGGIRVIHTGDWTEASSAPASLLLNGMTASRDGTLLATFGDNEIRILETQTFTERLRLTPPHHAGWLGECHLDFDADASHLVVHTALGVVMRWDLRRLEADLAALGFKTVPQGGSADVTSRRTSVPVDSRQSD